MSDAAEDRFEALQRFTREAAELLGAPETSERVQSLAALKLARLVQTERMLSGGNDTANLVALTQAIAAFTPVSDAPLPTITLTIVRPADAAEDGEAAVDGMKACRRCGWKPLEGDRVSRCYKCGATSTSDHNAPWCSPVMDVDPRTIDGEVVADAPDVQRALPSPVEEAKPAHPNDLPRQHPQGIHHARLPNGQPARMRRNDYTGIAADLFGGGTVNGNPFSAYGQPKPDISAGHPLRDPNDWDVVPK